MHQRDFSAEGFEWIEANDSDNSVLTFLRRGEGGRPMLVACNFTPVPRVGYRVGVPVCGAWHEVLADMKVVRVAVNQDMAAANAPLNPGDEVAFFPPVTGG